MPDPSHEIAAIEAGCHALGITLDPAWHDAILFNVRAIALQSASLLDPPLPDAVDPAPVFTA